MPRVNTHTEHTRLRRDLNAMVGDGVTFSVMVGIGEAYVPAFVLAAGLGEVLAGLVATLPMLVGAACQLVTPAGVRQLGSNKRWVVGCAICQAVSFGPLIWTALTGYISPFPVLLVSSLYWAFGMATSPAWNTWVGTLVPPERRARFFAVRAQWSQAAAAAALFSGGLILHARSDPARPMAIFALLFGAAAAARLLSASYLARQSEPRAATLVAGGLSLSQGLVRFAAGGGVLPFLLWMQGAVHVAAPFFTPYMLLELGLPYAGFTVLTATALVARIVALPLLGRIAQRFGTRVLMRLGGVGIVPLPALWLLSDSFAYLFGLQFLAGCVWAAFELATILAFLEGIDDEERTSVLTAFNFANALAIGVGSVIGSLAFRLCGAAAGTYGVLFVLSTVLRAVGLVLGRHIPSFPPAVTTVPLRTLAVRPSAGAIQRPVLAAVPGREERHPGSPEGHDRRR